MYIYTCLYKCVDMILHVRVLPVAKRHYVAGNSRVANQENACNKVKGSFIVHGMRPPQGPITSTMIVMVTSIMKIIMTPTTTRIF